MLEPSTPADEAQRTATLRNLHILDTPAEERFDRITRIAQRVLGVPIALVSLVDSNRQWFKSCQGLAASETPRGISFCGHAILDDAPLIIGDALSDPRFADNPLVTGEPRIRFYAGHPLKHSNGSRLGTLCVIDRRPREMSAADLAALADLAAWAEEELNVLNMSQALLIKHDSEMRLRAVLDNVPDGIIIGDERGMIESCNPAAERIFGYRARDMIGQPFTMLLPEPYAGVYLAYLSDYLRSGEAKILGTVQEAVGRRKDSGVFPIELSFSEVRLPGQRLFTGVVRDITERQQAARRLAQVTLLQQAILDAANYSIISTDPQGIIRTFNRAAQRWLGYSADEVVGKHTPAVIHDPDEVARRARQLSRELNTFIAPGFEAFVAKARLGEPDENEWIYVRKNGSRFPVLLSVTALHDADGVVTGFLGIASDITERKEIERMKNEFVSTVSHELRTPLTSIIGSLGLIKGGAAGALGEQSQILVNIAHKNAERLVRLINDILDIEKIESGKIEVRLEPLPLQPLLQQALDANAAYGAQFGVRFTLHGATNATVNVSPDHLMQVMTNLLSNAVKFSPPDAPVTVEVTQCDDRVRVAVIDRGPGIPEEFHTRIFQKFAQADSSDTRRAGGTGLGLNISKALVEKMSGRLDFTTKPGVGTTFYFDLPLWRAGPDAAQAVLICEDNPHVANLIGLILTQAGYRTETVPTAARARKMLAEKSYAALCLDLALPDANGLDLIGQIQSTYHIPVIVISALADLGQRVLHGAIGVIDWLEKPVDRDRLLAAVQRAVREPRSGEARILHVEDDADIIAVVAELTRGVAHVQGVANLAQAKRRLAQQDFDLVILDAMLPDGSGLELLPVLAARRPPTQVLLFSAQAVDPRTVKNVSAALVKSKISNEELLALITSLIKPHAAAQPDQEHT